MIFYTPITPNHHPNMTQQLIKQYQKHALNIKIIQGGDNVECAGHGNYDVRS